MVAALGFWVSVFDGACVADADAGADAFVDEECERGCEEELRAPFCCAAAGRERCHALPLRN